LDLLIDPTRVDEAVKLFGEWFASRSADERTSEIAAARQEAADSASVRSAVEQAAAHACRELTGPQLDKLSLSVAVGLDALQGDSVPDPAALVDQLTVRHATYAVWLDLRAVG